jgi:hypothetical protein
MFLSAAYSKCLWAEKECTQFLQRAFAVVCTTIPVAIVLFANIFIAKVHANIIKVDLMEN